MIDEATQTAIDIWQSVMGYYARNETLNKLILIQ